MSWLDTWGLKLNITMGLACSDCILLTGHKLMGFLGNGFLGEMGSGLCPGQVEPGAE